MPTQHPSAPTSRFPQLTRRTTLTTAAALALGAVGMQQTSAVAAPTLRGKPLATPTSLNDPFSPDLANPAPSGFAPLSPLSRAHAHNDYLHDRPLWDALGQGFTSVEADVWFRDGKLLLGHTVLGTASGRGVEDWYVKPLVAWVRAHGGAVFPGWGGQFTLLIDVKEHGAESLVALEAVLAKYPDVFWHLDGGREVPGPVRVVYSGERPTAAIVNSDPRFGSFDGHEGDLDSRESSTHFPLYSESWSSWGWQGWGAMPSDQFTHLAQFAESASANGARSRLWGQPMAFAEQRENVWKAQLDAGISLINADHLEHLREFLQAHGVA